MKAMLTFFLAISIALNGWLFYQLHNIPADDKIERVAERITNPRISDLESTDESTTSSDNYKAATELTLPTLIARLQTWFTNNDPRFYSALSEALRTYPDNWDLLLLEAEWVKRESTLSDAIIQYYKILEKRPPFALNKSINETINLLLTEAIQRLRRAGDWETLAVFIEPLYQFLPDERVLVVQLAEAYANQDKLTLMESVLASLPDDDMDALRIRETAYTTTATAPVNEPERENRVSANAYAMEVTRQGDHFLAPISLNNYNTALLIDTGASVTSVTFDVYKRLRANGGMKNMGKFTVNTAGGPVEATMMLLESVTFGPYALQNVAIMVMPPNTLEGTDGLLGMNILRRFDFHLDQRNSALQLSAIH